MLNNLKNLKKISFAAFAIFTATSAFGQNSIEDGKVWLTEKEDTAKAIAIFKTVAAANPKDGQAAFWLGQVAYAQGNSGEAKTQYDKAALSETNAHLGLLGQGKLALDAKDTKNAEKLFERAKSRSKTKAYKEGHPDVAMLVGEAFLKGKNVDTKKALENYIRARDIEPKKAKYWIALGDAHLAAGNAGPAMSAYESGVAKDATDPEIFQKMARIWSRGQNYTLAIENADKGLKIKNDYAPLWKDLIEYLTAAGKYGRITEALEKYTALAVTDYDARARFIKYLTYQAKAYDKAVEEANKVLAESKDPKYLTLNRWIAWARVRQGEQAEKDGKKEEAKKYFEDALNAAKALFAVTKEDERTGYDYEHYSKSAAVLGDFTTASQIMFEAVRLDTVKPKAEGEKAVYSKLADMYYEAGKYANTFRTLDEKFKKYGKNDDELFTYVVAAYFGLFDKDAAIKVTETEVDSAASAYIAYNPKAPDGYYYKGKAKERMSNGTAFDALAEAEKVIELATPENTKRVTTQLLWAYWYAGSAAASANNLVKANDYAVKGLTLKADDKKLVKLQQDLGVSSTPPVVAPAPKN